MPHLLGFTIALLVLQSSFAYSYTRTIFGDVSEEELAMTHCTIDSGASAVILFDVATNSVFHRQGAGYLQAFTRHVRIKIFEKEAYAYADIEIPLYHSKDEDKEILTSFKGATYNLVNGSVEGQVIDLNDGIKEENNGRWHTEKFALPNVRVGSVIEFEFTVLSPFATELKQWQMQFPNPVLLSEYIVTFPDELWYKMHIRGDNVLSENRSGKKNDKHIFYFKAENVPGFEEEPLMPDIENYLARVELELAYTDIPLQGRKDYSQTWEDVTDLLLKEEDFGIQLQKSHYARDFIKQLPDTIADTLDRAMQVFDHIKSHMKWDERNRIMVTSSLRSAYREQIGNSADINLMIVALLREAGIESYPVLVRTRGRGHVNPDRPLISQFNYVVAMTRIGTHAYFLDATDPAHSFGILPKRCLNGEGRLIDPFKGDWVTVTSNGIIKKMASSDLQLGEDGLISGHTSEIHKSYAAIRFRKEVESHSDLDAYFKKLTSEKPDLTFTSYSVDKLDTSSGPVKLEYDITLDSYTGIQGDFIYIDPMLTHKVEDNPFKQDTRKYPVDIVYPQEAMIVVNISIPEGYRVESMPEQAAYTLPGDGGLFTYDCMLLGSNLSVTNRIMLSKSVYPREEYQYIKEFFNLIVTKHAEQIVLKKKSL